MEQYMQITGMDVQTLMAQTKPQAEKNIKSRLVLEAVVKAEGIEASEEDVNEEIKRMAEAYKLEVEKVLEILGDAGKKQIADDLAVTKAAQFLVENAKEV